MQCMNVMQMQLKEKKKIWSQEIERINTKTKKLIGDQGQLITPIT